MRYVVFIVCLLTGCLHARANTQVTKPDEAAYIRMQQLSGTSLNTGVSSSVDSILLLARQVEQAARLAGDMGREFKARQVQVNISSQTGNLAIAAGKAQEMLDQATRKKNPLATGLALQAIGDTYLFAGRFAQADSVFTKAVPAIMQHGDAFMRMELLLQQLHVRLAHDSPRTSTCEIEEIRKLLGSNQHSLPGASIYEQLTDSYELLQAIWMQDTEKAESLLANIRQNTTFGQRFGLWSHYIESQYHILLKNYDKALQYCDSAVLIAQRGSNGDILHVAQISKANLLAKIGHYDQAADLYKEILSGSDSLYRKRYTTQIDSLHATYWIDQIKIARIDRRNTLYTKLIGTLGILVVITVVVMLLVRRKNRQLIKSRQELAKMRAASDDSLRNKSLFLSNMSHELRTPLNAITGFSAILTEDEQIDEQTQQQCSDYIRQNADLLLKLINDVVDLSELKDQSMHFGYEPCDVVALCRNVLHTVENVKHTEAQMQFVTELEELEITTDKNRLQQVLINLLINATKFSPEGNITLSLQIDRRTDEAIFAVEDTGCGIPPEKQPRIFERFEKLHEGVQGAGLGLSICKLIVEHTGGRIWIDPTYTHGARFVFTHPLTHKAQQA